MTKIKMTILFVVVLILFFVGMLLKNIYYRESLQENKYQQLTAEDEIAAIPSVEQMIKYAEDHTPTINGGNVKPTIKMELNNGYCFYYYDGKNSQVRKQSHIIYGDRFYFDSEIACALHVEQFSYTDSFVFAISSEDNYRIIDTKSKTYVYIDEDKNGFWQKIDELCGETELIWYANDGSIVRRRLGHKGTVLSPD